MTEQDESSGLVPGPSAWSLYVSSRLYVLLCVACLLPIFLGTVLPHDYAPFYTLFLMAVMVTFIALNVRAGIRSRRVAAKETARGYTTMFLVAKRKPNLFYLQSETFAIVAGPGEPRPAVYSKKIVADTLALRVANGQSIRWPDTNLVTSTPTNTSVAFQEKPTKLVPGPSASILVRPVVFWGVGVMVPTLVGRLTKNDFIHVPVPVLVSSLIIGAVSWVFFIRSALRVRRLRAQEIAYGYTTFVSSAKQQPELFLLDRRTLDVLSGPGEPRPLNLRKDETAKALARRTANAR